jgi:hypothetical protein
MENEAVPKTEVLEQPQTTNNMNRFQKHPFGGPDWKTGVLAVSPVS